MNKYIKRCGLPILTALLILNIANKLSPAELPDCDDNVVEQRLLDTITPPMEERGISHISLSHARGSHNRDHFQYCRADVSFQHHGMKDSQEIHYAVTWDNTQRKSYSVSVVD